MARMVAVIRLKEGQELPQRERICEIYAGVKNVAGAWAEMNSYIYKYQLELLGHFSLPLGQAQRFVKRMDCFELGEVMTQKEYTAMRLKEWANKNEGRTK